ncbi:GNAT family N-acetyltransferase [Caloranaerobacter sp. DY30410]|uniref:GNAT family N-acetyltransferase n=1 Tax=Caloranaerobacter sp. DY30410 TaxID=3238305 RepID=UPI003D032547
MEKIINGFRYVLKKSSEISEEEAKHFIDVFNNVFNKNYGMDWFIWKYIDNIYGDSFIVIVYDKDKPIAVRSFWRNDIKDKTESYQPADTSVLQEYRGKGIFSNMTKLVLSEIGDSIIYNYPNQNSFPGYIKLGWKLKYKYHLHPIFSKKVLKNSESIVEIDDKYLNWRFADCPIKKYYYYEYDGRYYLLVRRKNNIYYVLGKFNKEFINKFEKAKAPIMFYYSDKKSKLSILNNKSNLVMKNCDSDNIGYISIIKNDTI